MLPQCRYLLRFRTTWLFRRTLHYNSTYIRSTHNPRQTSPSITSPIYRATPALAPVPTSPTPNPTHRHTQTSTMSASIDIASLNTDSSPEHESKIIAILSNAINKLPPTEDSAETIAGEIDALYPTDGSGAEDFLWSFWTLLVGVAKKIPAEDPRQQLLVSTVAKLKTKRDQEVEMWGQKTRVWSELPMLGPVMRDEWNLSPDFDGSEKDNATIPEWISINSFAARMYGASLQSWVNLGIWELRSGLEETPEDRPNAKDTRIATASEWIMHAGKELYAQGQKVQKLDAMEQRALKPGSLLKIEQSGLSNERWRFWRERIGALGAGAGSGAAKEKAQKAMETMKEIEGK